MNDREEAVARFYERGTPIILTVAVLLTALGGWLATGLTLDSQLERLLPSTAPSVQGLERLETSYGQEIGRLALVIQGPQPQQNVAAVDALSEMLADHELVANVESQRPVDFFRDHRLMYLELEDAKEVASQVEKRIKWEKRQANPMFVGLGSDDPPEIDLSEIEEKYEADFRQQRYLTDEARHNFVIYVDPTFPNTEFQKTGRLVEDIESFFDAEIASEGSEVSMAFSGRFMKFYETQESIRNDLTVGTSLALLGIVLFLIAYFRSWVYPLLIAVPLLASTVWSFGWAQIVFGSLNILTGFLGAVLMGLGIDYGIHIVSSFQESRRGHTPREALVRALEIAGKPSLYAGITTLVALGSLTYSSFQAFFEFGVLALGGLTLILLSYAFVLPCLLLLVADTRIEPDPRMPADNDHRPVTVARNRLIQRVALLVLSAGTILAVMGLPNSSFEFDFRKLMPADLPAFKVEGVVDEVVDMAQPPAVVLVDDREHALAVEDELEKRMEERSEAEIIEEIFTVYDFIPAQQTAKLELWGEVFEDLKDVPKSRRKKDEKLRDFYAEVEGVLETGAVEVADLPAQIQKRFSRTDAPGKTVVLILPKHYIHNANDAMKYVAVTSDLPGPDGQGSVDPISQEALLADILGHIKSDTLYLVLIALAGLFGMAWFAFRDVKRLLLSFVTVAAGVAIGTGLIGLAGVSFNFMNMVIWPIWLGLGVDAVFHLSSRVANTPQDWSGFRHTAGAVFAAFLTTMIGFGALSISDHRGLASLGQVAVIGLGSILLVSLAIHVFFLEPAGRDRGSGASGGADS